MSDIRFALRTLTRTPGVSAVVVLSLALGIGANTAIYSLMRQTIIRNLPVVKPGELVLLYQPGTIIGRVQNSESDNPAFTYHMFRELQKIDGPFAGVAGSYLTDAGITFGKQSKRGDALLVSGSYFPVLGVQPVLGRLLSAEDDKVRGGHAVVVLSHRYWQNDLGGRSDVLNEPIRVNGNPFTIVGVTPPGFRAEAVDSNPDLFIPLQMKPQMTPTWNGMDDRQDYWLNLFARLKPGITAEQAQAQMDVPYKSLLLDDVKQIRDVDAQGMQAFTAKRLVLKPGRYGRGDLRRQAAMPLLILMGITGFVLLIACANAANLLLARAAGRRKEIAVRIAIGASRWRLVRQLLIEACVLSLAGGLAGLLVAQWTLDALVSTLPKALQRSGMFASGLSLDVLLYSLGASLTTGLGFGLFPALQATRSGISDTLKDQGEILFTHGIARWFRGAMVAGQVAISLMLLVASGLLALSMVKLARVELGVRSERVLTFSLNPTLAGYNQQRTLQLYNTLQDRLKAFPGVENASMSSLAFLTGNDWGMSLTVEGFEPKRRSDSRSSFSAVGPGFFATMGIPLLQGRDFTRADADGAPKVAIANESFVKRFAAGRDPIGLRFKYGRGAGPFDHEIVGVVKDTKYDSVRDEIPPVFYTPTAQNPDFGFTNFYVRTATDPERMAPQIRREIAAVDAAIPIDVIQTMESQIEDTLYAERLISVFSAGFAVLATILAAIGLYGVLAYMVARRTREIGIRMALGAQAGSVRALVMGDVALMAGAGVIVGLGGAYAFTKVFASLVYQVDVRDVRVMAAATLLLIVVALIAGFVPARRATRVDPLDALRYQ